MSNKRQKVLEETDHRQAQNNNNISKVFLLRFVFIMDMLDGNRGRWACFRIFVDDDDDDDDGDACTAYRLIYSNDIVTLYIALLTMLKPGSVYYPPFAVYSKCHSNVNNRDMSRKISSARHRISPIRSVT